MWAHAKRVLRTRLNAAASSALGAGIATLERLRQRTGGARDAEAEAGSYAARPRNPKPRGEGDAAAIADDADAAAPRPKRRLRGFLVLVCVLLAGGMGGGALAYELLASLLDRQAAENARLQAALSKQSKSAASSRNLLAEAQRKLEQAQVERADTEKKLEASIATSSKAAELQAKLDQAEKRAQPSADRTSGQGPSVAGGGTKQRLRPPKSGDCTLGARNIGALKDCVEAFNR